MASVTVTSCVICVSDLDRSVLFYRDIFQCAETVREPDAALVVSPDGFQLYLRRTGHPGVRRVGEVGIDQLVWSVDSEAELHRIERRFRAHDASIYTATRHGITFLDGIDPDGIRVLITHPTPRQLPREVIDDRFR